MIPNDIESFGLDGKRVFIDLSPTNPKRIFKITRTDDPLYNYNSHGGILSLIADKTEFNPDNDNQELRICDYIDPSTPIPPSPSNPDETTDLTALITGNINLKNGYTRTYTAKIQDKYGNDIEWDDALYSWRVISDFLIEQTIVGNKIKLKVKDESLIGSSFLLQLIMKDKNLIIAEIRITIVELIG